MSAYGYGKSGQMDPVVAAKEAYRTIRANLMFSVAHAGCKTFVFTSAEPGEGKTTTAVNVAFSFARSEKKVLLVDMDLRRPTVHRLLKLKAVPGLTNFLGGFNSLEEVVHKNVFPNLDLISAGSISPNPSEMAASSGVMELLEQMKSEYDFIIIDAPPVNAVADALSVIRISDGVVFVVRPRFTTRKEVKAAIDRISFAGGKTLGVVVNGASVEKGGYRRYNYYGKSASGEKSGEGLEGLDEN